MQIFAVIKGHRMKRKLNCGPDGTGWWIYTVSEIRKPSRKKEQNSHTHIHSLGKMKNHVMNFKKSSWKRKQREVFFFIIFVWHNGKRTFKLKFVSNRITDPCVFMQTVSSGDVGGVFLKSLHRKFKLKNSHKRFVKLVTFRRPFSGATPRRQVR